MTDRSVVIAFVPKIFDFRLRLGAAQAASRIREPSENQGKDGLPEGMKH